MKVDDKAGLYLNEYKDSIFIVAAMSTGFSFVMSYFWHKTWFETLTIPFDTNFISIQLSSIILINFYMLGVALLLVLTSALIFVSVSNICNLKETKYTKVVVINLSGLIIFMLLNILAEKYIKITSFNISIVISSIALYIPYAMVNLLSNNNLILKYFGVTHLAIAPIKTDTNKILAKVSVIVLLIILSMSLVFVGLRYVGAWYSFMLVSIILYKLYDNLFGSVSVSKVLFLITIVLYMASTLYVISIYAANDANNMIIRTQYCPLDKENNIDYDDKIPNNVILAMPKYGLITYKDFRYGDIVVENIDILNNYIINKDKKILHNTLYYKYGDYFMCMSQSTNNSTVMYILVKDKNIVAFKPIKVKRNIW